MTINQVDHPPIPDHQELSYPYFQSKVADHQAVVDVFKNAGVSPDPKGAYAIFRAGLDLDAAFSLWSKSLGFEVLNKIYPKRRSEILNPIMEMNWYCLDYLNPQDLNRTETEKYVEAIMSKSIGNPSIMPAEYCSYDETQKYYYVRPLMTYGIQESPESRLVAKLSQDQNYQLTDSELHRVLDHEDHIYKLHLNIPPAKRADFLKYFYAEKEKTRQIAKQLGNHSPDELFSAGAKAVGIGPFKFAGFNDQTLIDHQGNTMPDFIFYLPHRSDADQEKDTLIRSLSLLVTDYEDTDSPPPRFSTPVTGPDGHRHLGLTQVQGDGDFKTYLQRIGRLDEFYDSSKNYAVRKQKPSE